MHRISRVKVHSDDHASLGYIWKPSQLHVHLERYNQNARPVGYGLPWGFQAPGRKELSSTPSAVGGVENAASAKSKGRSPINPA